MTQDDFGVRRCDVCKRVLTWNDFFVVVGPDGLPNSKDDRCAACFLAGEVTA